MIVLPVGFTGFGLDTVRTDPERVLFNRRLSLGNHITHEKCLFNLSIEMVPVTSDHQELIVNRVDCEGGALLGDNTY